MLKEGERIDDLQRSNLKIIQNPLKFCFGMDAVLLSGFVKAAACSKVLDLCTGTGIIAILLSAKTKASHITGIEIQKDIADMASRSIELNNLNDKIDIINGDIKSIERYIKSQSIDIVTVNPPYMSEECGITSSDDTLAISRHEIACTLDDVINASVKSLKNGGRLYMVHRPHRYDEIVYKMQDANLAIKRVRFVHPYIDRDANMVLIEAIKGGGHHLIVEKPLIVFSKKDKYTKEITDVYGY